MGGDTANADRPVQTTRRAPCFCFLDTATQFGLPFEYEMRKVEDDDAKGEKKQSRAFESTDCGGNYGKSLTFVGGPTWETLSLDKEKKQDAINNDVIKHFKIVSPHENHSKKELEANLLATRRRLAHIVKSLSDMQGQEPAEEGWRTSYENYNRDIIYSVLQLWTFTKVQHEQQKSIHVNGWTSPWIEWVRESSMDPFIQDSWNEEYIEEFYKKENKVVREFLESG